MNIFHNADGYKTGHLRQLPEGITSLYGNGTFRKSRLPGVDHVVSFGLQAFLIQYLQEGFREFFANPEVQIAAYKRRLDAYLGPDAVPVDHLRELADLGYVPLRMKALPEGTLVPIQVPLLTIESTHHRFAWLEQYIETMLSAQLWGPCTSATIAYQYRLAFERAAKATGADRSFVKWQGHDFSMRGMFGVEAAAMSGAAHLTCFTGTDTIPAIDWLEKYYGADVERELVGGSVPATEHAVMCAGGGGRENPSQELSTYRRLLTEVYPTGIISIVSDTWDFWQVVRYFLRHLKSVILGRNGKLVIRPDSGDPVKILVGDPESDQPLARAGLIEALWDIFGGTTTATGHRVLDPHIGAIYGDSITLERQREILDGLAAKGFASSNMVLGIGSFSYQYNTRDTLGFAMKATHCTVNGKERLLYKEPKTDPGKKSHRGLIAVQWDKERQDYIAKFPATRDEEENRNELLTVFEDGRLIAPQTLAEIRNRIDLAIGKELR